MLTPPAPRSRPARARRLLTGNARILELGVTRTGPFRRAAGERPAQDVSRAHPSTDPRPGRGRALPTARSVRPVDAARRQADPR
ncbi:hypothetical protein ACFV23_32780 [Streptomyces sp. NPDC059627]